MPPFVFITYRREDSGVEALAISAALRVEAGRDGVFLDVSSIPPGTRWPKRVRSALRAAKFVVAVIGPKWLRAGSDQWGARRIDQRNDWVRQELSLALRADKVVVPVLVRGGKMPPAEALPKELSTLPSCQQIELRTAFWEHDIKLLVDHLRGRLPNNISRRDPTTDAGLTDTAAQIPRAGEATSKVVVLAPNRWSKLRATLIAAVLLTLLLSAIVGSRSLTSDRSSKTVGTGDNKSQTEKTNSTDEPESKQTKEEAFEKRHKEEESAVVPPTRSPVKQPMNPSRPGKGSGDAVTVQSQFDVTRHCAFLVGTQEYDGVGRLKHVEDDVHELRQVLKDSGYGITTFLNARLDDFSPALSNWLKERNTQDAVIVYLNGHGIAVAGQGYYVPKGAQIPSMRTEQRETRDLTVQISTDVVPSPVSKDIDVRGLYSFAQLTQDLRECRAKEKLLILDVCNAGSARRELNEASPGGPRVERLSTDSRSRGISGIGLLPEEARKETSTFAIFSSCRESENSYECLELKHGVFTYWLCCGLAGHADQSAFGNKDGLVELMELKNYVHENVVKYAATKLSSSQHPGVGGHQFEGPIFLTRCGQGKLKAAYHFEGTAR